MAKKIFIPNSEKLLTTHFVRKRYYYSNQSDCLAKKRDYAKNNHDTIVARHKDYYETNKEHCLSKQKDYAIANRDKILVYQKAYRDSRKDERNAKQRAYAEAKKASGYRYMIDPTDGKHHWIYVGTELNKGVDNA